MKTKICSAILCLIAGSAFSQVGIGTPTPAAMLDVNGTMKIRNTPTAPALPGYQILALNQNTGGDFQVAQVSPQLIVDAAVNTINTTNVNASAYAAKKSGGISLLSVDLFSTWRQVNFTTADRTVGTASLLSNTDNSYTVPSSGVYAVGYYFRYGTGLQASILAGTPGIGIIKNTGGTYTVLDTREFSGLNLAALLNITFSESSINSLYRLQANDKLYFGLTGSGGLTASLLGSSTASFYIYRVSN